MRWAQEILAAVKSANAGGAGAFGNDGVLIDMAVAKIAQAVCDRHELIARATGEAGGDRNAA